MCADLRAARDEDVLEVLACPAARAAVHVPLVTLLEHEARLLEDLRVKVATVVDDDHHAPTWPKHSRAGAEDACDALRVHRERRLRRAAEAASISRSLRSSSPSSSYA